MRKPIIAGNWKMFKTVEEAASLAETLKVELHKLRGADIVICPPYTALLKISGVLNGSNIELGAQDMHWEKEGAFTGEISPMMLKDVGVRYVIIGHSERRQYFAETNEAVNKKVKAALSYNLVPIMCVGENLAERDKNLTFKVVREHVEEGLRKLDAEDIPKVVIAYEPVWAIGTGKTATAEQAQEVHQFIRELIARKYTKKAASRVRIQYGGSVKPDNIAALMAQPDLDGALVGGASLSAVSFSEIAKNSAR